MRRVAGGRVGSVSSTADAINAINAFVVASSPKHNLSTESWKAMWSANVPAAPDGSLGKADKGIVADLLNRLDACAAVHGCEWSADELFKTMNREQFLPSDNGLMSFGQFMTLLNRYPVNADDPKGTKLTPADVPGAPDPETISEQDRADALLTDEDIKSQCTASIAASPLGSVSLVSEVANCVSARAKARAAAKAKIERLGATMITDDDRRSAALTDADIERLCAPLAALPGYGGMDGCRATFRKTRADAQTKIAKLEGAPPGFLFKPVQEQPDRSLPSPEKRAAEAFAIPTAIGALGALRWGWASFLVGGAVGVVAATGAYLWTKMRGSRPSPALPEDLTTNTRRIRVQETD
jgi:hypothetical protein